MSAEVDSFLWAATDAAGTTYDRTLGFQPAMLLIWACGSPSTTDLVQRQSSITGWGFGASSTDRRSACFGSGDNLANAILFIRHADDCVLTLPSVTGADGGTLDIAAEASWPANGIRFVVDTPAGGDIIVHVLALDGTDITAVKTLAFQEPASTGNQTIAHGLGTTPTGVLFASVGFATAPPSGSNTQGMFMCGASDGSSNWVCFRGADDANTTMDTASYAKSGECIALAPEPAVTLNARASCTGLDATNITLNWVERASNRYVFALVWAGGEFTVGTTLTQTHTNQFDGPTAGFTPLAALFASACGAESAADTPTPHAHLSLGAATSSTERVCQSVLDEDGVGTSEVTVAVEYDEVYAHISNTSTIDALMDVADLSVDPMQLVMDDPEASVQSFVGVAIWGATPAGGTAVPVFVHHYRQQGIM